MSSLIAPPAPEIILADGSTFTPGKGGAGSPELAYMTDDGRRYVDPLPWCPLLGSIGIREEGFEAGATFPSVTTRLGYLPKDRLIGWTATQVAECAARTPWVLTRFGEKIATSYWRTAGERTRDEAGERGTLVHDVAEDGEKVLHTVADELLAGRHPDPWFLERSKARAYVRALQRFFAAYPGIRPIWVEVTVYSRRWGVAGTLDLIAWVPRLGFCLIDWKGLAVDTPIPTPNGWSTMGELQVGDQVFGADGKPCNVVAKSQVHHRPCYRVCFDDGTSIVCDNEHLWQVIDNQRMGGKRDHSIWRVIDTDEMARTHIKGLSGSKRYAIKLARPLNLPERDLPIDPYLLGAWIGDGTASVSAITLNHRDADGILEEFRTAGYDVHAAGASAIRGGSTTYYVAGGFRGLLDRNGLLGCKHVPDVYLRASRAQRTALLQGLMDTDGCYNAARSECTFNTVDKALAHQVYELVVSLGERAYLWEGQRKGFGLTVTAYEVKFRPHVVAPFRHRPHATLAAVAADPGSVQRKRRVVVSVQPVETVPTQCVAVDSVDNLYLAGEQMVPTHNTSRFILPKFSFQMAAYHLADYGIVDGRRVPVPKVDASYVVHLMPGDLNPETGEHEGAFEVVPMDNDPEQLEIFKAMDIVARWDHPSRIGAPLPDPSTDGLTGTVYGVEMPPVTFLTAEEAAATVVAKDEALFASVFDQPTAAPEPEQHEPDIEALAEERVAEAWADVVMAERAWVVEQIGIIEGAAAQGNVTAQFCSQQLATWWLASGLPMPTDPEFGTSEEQEPRYLELLDGLQAATDQLEAPFAARPRRPDLGELFDRFVAEEQERRAQRPKATMDELGRLLVASQRGVVGPIEGRAFVLARRGQSVSAEEWGKPADPEMSAACAELRSRASELPADILKQLDIWARENGVPNIMSPQLTAEQLEVITARVEQAFIDWDDRQMQAKTVLAEVCTDADLEEIGLLLLTTAGPADLIRDASAEQLRRFTLLCAAVERGDLALGVGDDERLTFTVAVTEADLVARWGSKKVVRDAARAAHIALDLKLPRSTSDILADPLMVAAIGVGPSDEAQTDEAA